MSGVNLADFPNPLGFVQLVGAAASVGLPTIPAGAQAALVNVDAQSIRWTDDGTTPTATVGMLLPVSTERLFVGNLAKIKLIQTAATATINVSYYK